MGLTSLQVCMDTSEWLQGTIDEEGGMDSSPISSGGGDMMTCSRVPLVERRLRPQHDQALKCPRCDSTHTKFCYYNNYSLSQPRYFCKTCRRYWTKGGSLRNIPVGGGCRKNKRPVAVKKSSSSSSSTIINSRDHHHHYPNPNLSSNINNIDTTTTDLHLSFPHEAVQLPHFTSLFGNSADQVIGGLNLMETKYSAILDNPRHDDHFMESSSSKYHDHNLIIAAGNPPTNHDFMGSSTDLGLVGGLGLGDVSHDQQTAGFTSTVQSNFHGFCSPFGIKYSLINGGINNNHHESNNLMMNMSSTTSQRLMLPFDQENDNHHHHHHHEEEEEEEEEEDPNHAFEMKPNSKQLLSLDQHQWINHHQHDQAAGCNEVGKDSFGYFSSNSLGSWTGMMNGYGSSHQTNPLV